MESDGSGYIMHAPTDEETRKEQGITIALHMKNRSFMDKKVLRELVVEYSEFIHFPIQMIGQKEIEEEVDDEEG